MSSDLLNSTAVGRRKGDEASEILQAYIATGPDMALTHTAEVAPQVAPAGGTRPKGAGGNIELT